MRKGWGVDSLPVWMSERSHGNADLIARFFRRAFGFLRDGGALGLVATNTIGQGDTRSTGLRRICINGGTIYSARHRWPGEAAVVVSVLHIAKGGGPRRLDGREDKTISAFLFHRGGHDDPARLEANTGKSFLGGKIYSNGFTFDDTDVKGVATPLAEMRRLIAADPHNEEAILPYIGEEVDTSPTHAHHRHVINFRDWPLRREDPGASWRDATEDERRSWRRDGIAPLDYLDPVAADCLLTIVEEQVKPERAHLTNNAIGRKRAKFWWQYGSLAKELHAAIEGLDRVLVTGGSHHMMTFVPSRQVFLHKLIVFPLASMAPFATLQSRVHEI